MSKIPFRDFPPYLAVCCAHFVAVPDTMFHFLHAGNSTCIQTAPLPIKRILALWGPLLFFVVQIPHLQPEKYFPSGTEGELPGTGKRGRPGVRPDGKCFLSCFSLARKILRSFFYSLNASREAGVGCNTAFKFSRIGYAYPYKAVIHACWTGRMQYFECFFRIQPDFG